MDPLAMVDSDLYQHLLNVESEHNIAPKNTYNTIFGSYSNYNLNMSPSNISISSLYSTTNTSNTSSTTSISSLSTMSDDDITSHDYLDLPQLPDSYLIDGGLQRALVIMVPDPKLQLVLNRADSKTFMSFTDYSAAYDDRLTINEDDECCTNKTEIDTNTNTFSFKSWMESYKNQPHRILGDNRRRRTKCHKRKKKRDKIKHMIANKEQLIYLTNLRNDLPLNPRKARKFIRDKRRSAHVYYETHIDIESMSGIHGIEAIQQKIIALQNQLEDVRNIERIKTQLNHWKHYKLNSKNWRLIDFYAYLVRMRGRKYAKYFLNFEVFYTQWMDIYELDEKSSSAHRFASNIFNGRMLIHLDHNDLIMFGVNTKEDRREILIQIQMLNKTQKQLR